MKQLLILIIILLFSHMGYSQKHIYSYDGSGNRIKREYAVVSPPNGPFRKRADALIKDSIALQAYPNPFSDEVTIRLSSTEELGVIDRLVIYSETGQLVQEISMNSRSKTINTQRLSNGKYILRVFRKEETQEFILIKN